MKQLTVDFETYYDKDYSLSKMTTDGYVRSPRFETMGVSVAEGDNPPVWFSGTEKETADWLDQYDWENSAVLCHNTLFDGFILAQRFRVRPKLWMDTLGMARRFLPWLPSHSLAALAKHFALPAKGTEVLNMMGRSRQSMTLDDERRYGEYCNHDVELTYAIGQKFIPRMDGLELRLLDMTVRMFTEPQFVGDRDILKVLHASELRRKEELIEMYGGDKKTLMSNPKMAEALIALGVTPPMKVSLRTGKEALAFAKSDKEFTALLEHDDERVQALVSARLGVKTTIAETRALRFLQMTDHGDMPVALGYWGAKTTGRHSGTNKCNFQNLSARGPSAGIRTAIKAPPGCVVIAGDSSNIELRVMMVGAGQTEVVEKIRDGIDLYCDFASAVFGRKVTKANKMERMLGKIAMLSLQYGAGWAKFKEMVRIESSNEIILSDAEAEKVVNLYRHIHYRVIDMHNRVTDVLLPDMANGGSLIPVDELAWCLTSNNGFGIAAAQGVVYHDLRQTPGERNGRKELQWTYQAGRKRVKVYGGKCVDGDTLVLTEVGWKPLRLVGSERVHDGVDFVRHGGLSFNGAKQCVAVDGVMMTPDHEVLTDEGWKAALENPRPHRADLRHVNHTAARPHRREEDPLAVPVQLREAVRKSGSGRRQGGEARRDSELRMCDQPAYVREADGARHEQASGLCSVAQHVRSLPTAVASGISQLWSAGHNGVRRVADKLLCLLARHGSELSPWAYAGPTRQREGVRRAELRVENVQATGTEQAEQSLRRPSRNIGANRYRPIDAVLPAEARDTTGARNVYDIVNCGPRRRYVVMGDGGPFIVHNCSENWAQYVARMIVMWQTARINQRYPVALTVHDEAVAVVRQSEVEEATAYFTECLSLAPPWCRGHIPLACEVSHGPSYADCK